MRLQISSIFFLLHLIVSVAGEERCGLNCEHGECTLVSDKQDERAAMVQSGKMIEQCTCEDGYGGVACDILIQPCQSDGKCRNGRACQRDRESGELSCDCSDADGVSRFAGLMCRNPYTEYCADKYDPNESTSFCTNGGKCKSSFIGAQVAPGNTTINNAYSHLGCVCPKEFYGPHCEFLKYNRETSSETNEDTKGTSGGEEDQETNKDEGNINEPLPPSQVQDPEDENTQRNVSMIAGFSFLAAFAVLLVLLGMMSRYAARQEMLSGHLHINSTDIGHDYPPDYADGTISYGETDLYPQELCQPPAMSGGGSIYSDNPYDTGNQRAEAGLYREEDGLEHLPTYRSNRRMNPPLYVDFETSTRPNDRRYRGYREDDQAPTDWASGASYNTTPWENKSHGHGYHVQ